MKHRGLRWLISVGALLPIGLVQAALAESLATCVDSPAVTNTVVNRQWLNENRAAIDRGETLRSQALSELIHEADEALQSTLLDITAKSLLPPSGDAQDYMSLGPYWWPDPEKPDGLPWIRKDGEVNPLAYADDTDKARLRSMADSLEPLAFAYHFTADAKYAARAAELLDVWFVAPKTRMNPHLKFAQSIPGRTPGRSVGIIDGRQLSRVIHSLSLIQCSDALSAAQSRTIKTWFDDFLTWLTTSELGIGEMNANNNHGTHYDAQVVTIAVYLEKPELALRLLQQTKQRITQQIMPDGSQPHELSRTRPFHYSLFNLEALFRLAQLAEPLDIDLWNYPSSADARLRLALRYLLERQDPEQWNGSQETDIKSAALNSYVRRAALVYGSEPYKKSLLVEQDDQLAAAINCALLFPPKTDTAIGYAIKPTQAVGYQRCVY